MKAILVIEMPDICYKCPCYDHEGGICQATSNWKTNREDGCPLRPMPRKLDANDWHRMFGGKYKEREAKGYGWNACLDEITGETE